MLILWERSTCLSVIPDHHARSNICIIPAGEGGERQCACAVVTAPVLIFLLFYACLHIVSLLVCVFPATGETRGFSVDFWLSSFVSFFVILPIVRVARSFSFFFYVFLGLGFHSLILPSPSFTPAAFIALFLCCLGRTKKNSQSKKFKNLNISLNDCHRCVRFSYLPSPSPLNNSFVPSVTHVCIVIHYVSNKQAKTKKYLSTFSILWGKKIQRSRMHLLIEDDEEEEERRK